MLESDGGHTQMTHWIGVTGGTQLLSQLNFRYGIL